MHALYGFPLRIIGADMHALNSQSLTHPDIFHVGKVCLLFDRRFLHRPIEDIRSDKVGKPDDGMPVQRILLCQIQDRGTLL